MVFMFRFIVFSSIACVGSGSMFRVYWLLLNIVFFFSRETRAKKDSCQKDKSWFEALWEDARCKRIVKKISERRENGI